MKRRKSVTCCFLILVLLVSLIMPRHTYLGADEDGDMGDMGGVSDGLEGEVSEQDLPAASDGSYLSYLEEHGGVPTASRAFTVNAADYTGTDQRIEKFTDYEGMRGTSILTTDVGYIEWEFDVPETAMYQISASYFPYGGNGSVIERGLYIDGEIPYNESKYINFTRLWKDVTMGTGKDVNGNDIKPAQEEVKVWQDIDVKDGSGYFDEPLYYYLEKGRHTLKLVSEREPLMLYSLTFYHKESVKSYEQVKADYAANGYREAVGENIFIQAEDMFLKTEKSNYPINDRSSSFTQPQAVYSILLNSMGGTKWQNVTSKAIWQVSVPASGLYKIALRCRQNVNSGIFSTRRLEIDGSLPFVEDGNIKFNYNADWEIKVVGSGSEEFLFYFEAGRTYGLSMEVVLGDTADILRMVEEAVIDLNEIYRTILMMTGANPDKYRDYSFEKIIPDTLANMVTQADKLNLIINTMFEVTGEKGERMAQLSKLENQVRRMATRPEEIAGKFGNFKDNLAALGSWILETAKQPLEVDYIALVPSGNKLPKVEGNFFQKLLYAIQTFFASFFIDYSKVGMTEESEGDRGEITVWLATGRDQQNTIRNLINSDFTRNYKIKVDLQLVNPGTLLPSILAGTGPDVSLSNGIGEPINFALRNAVKDISGFPGFDEVRERFHTSAFIPYEYYGAVYALPETQSFNMLFYRTDIFEELGISVPTTWNELNHIIGELQKMNMSIGIPHDLNTMMTFMYQMDAPLYLDNGKSSNLGSREAMVSFQKMVEYYSLYNLPTEYDFVNRFRSGEMPLAMADYTVYNQLSLFAPEIKGNWAMTNVPGTIREDGTVNYTIPSGGTNVMMMENTKVPDLAWEFMKWWTSKETQAAFGIEMESVINASAKQPTANVEALKMLPWPSRDLENILKQWEHVSAIPEVPGGYYASRIITFAYNKAFNEKGKLDPIDVLETYIDSLDAELLRKRAEFGIVE